MIFDGRAFAREIEAILRQRLRIGGRVPKIVSILVGDDPASALYTSLKQKAAERVGIEYKVKKLVDAREIEKMIKNDKSDGLMIQLPVPDLQGLTLKEVIDLIPLNKDVDGLRWEESGVMPATVRAILSILDKIAVTSDTNHETRFWEKKFIVVGGTGAVGRPLVHYLKIKYGVEAEIANSKTVDLSQVVKKSNVVISCVGRAGLITKEMVDSNKIVIDVGINATQIQSSEFRIQKQNLNYKLKIPKFSQVVGDMEREVYEIVKIAVPVPGGVGPVTVASLMKNAWDMVKSNS